MKKESKRRYLIAILIMLSMIFTASTFAYWATSVEGTQSKAVDSIQIGYGDTVGTIFSLTNELNTGGYLVPSNQLENSNVGAVDSVNLFYDIEWKEDEDYTQLDGTRTTGNLDITHQVFIMQGDVLLSQDEYSDIYDLINVSYNSNNIDTLTLDADAETLQFTVTLDEPENSEAYRLISNALIEIVFIFEIDTDNIETSDLNEEVVDEELVYPLIILEGDDTIYVEVGTKYAEEGYTAYDSLGNVISNTWRSGAVNFYDVGTYQYIYGAYSSADNTLLEYAYRTIVVVDTTAPEITLNGEETTYVELGTYFSDWGAWAVDNSGDEMTVETTGVESVDIYTAGTYYITYTSTDNSGNEAISVRTVVVR